jgi:hypothetical protein
MASNDITHRQRARKKRETASARTGGFQWTALRIE